MAESNGDTPLCPCGFWGSIQTAGLCSKCYKEMLRKQECSGHPLQTPNPSTQLVTTSDNTKSQLSQKLSENIDLIFSSNHNNKPQDAPNREEEDAFMLANDDEEVYLMANTSVVQDQSTPNLTTTATTTTTTTTTPTATTTTATTTTPTATTTTTSALPLLTSTSETTTTATLPPSLPLKPQSASSQLMITGSTSVNTINSILPNDPSLMAARTNSTLINPTVSLIYPSVSLMDPSMIAVGPSSSSTPTLAMYVPADKTVSDATNDDTIVTSLDSGSTEKPIQKNRKRCFKCNCKLDLASSTIGKCKCDYVFCDLHRLPEQHDCTFDHKTHGRQDARKKMISPKKHMGTSLRRLDS